jgi:PKD repeat protein
MQPLSLEVQAVSRSAARFFLFGLLVLVAACDKVALLAPTGSTVTLSITPTNIGGNGTAQIIATVIEAGGTPVHDGTEVTFQSSVGTVDPAVARTERGIARATLRANGASGTARVIAFSGGAASDEVEVSVGSAAAETVTVRATPSSIPANGGPVQVTATVRDVSGDPLAGATVVFASDNGSLSSNSAVTDANGEATVALTTTRQTVVRASVAGKEGQTTINVASFPTATITLNPATPVAGQTFQVTITPSVPTGGSPIQNVIVDFGDGQTRTLGAAGGAVTVAHTYNRPGTFTITVTLVDAAGERATTSTVVTIQSAAVGVAVTASPNPATAGQPTTLTATITNPNNVQLTTVRFNFGDGTTSTQAVAGNAASVSTQHTYQSAGNFTVTVIATDAAGNQYPGSSQLTVNPRAAVQVTLVAAPTENAGGNQFVCTPEGDVFPKTCRTSFSSFVPPPGGTPGVRVVFTAGVTGGLASPASFQWNFGDGSPTETTTASSRDHLFRTPGTFVIRVRVTLTDGSVGEQQLTLEITP